MLRTKQILQLLSDGVAQNRICSEVHCSKRLVSAIKKMAGDTCRSYGELLSLPDSELSTVFQVKEASSPGDPRKDELDRMMPEIIRRLGRKHSNVQFVYEDYIPRLRRIRTPLLQCAIQVCRTDGKGHVGRTGRRGVCRPGTGVCI